MGTPAAKQDIATKGRAEKMTSTAPAMTLAKLSIHNGTVNWQVKNIALDTSPLSIVADANQELSRRQSQYWCVVVVTIATLR